MSLRDVKDQIAKMSATELAEMETYIHELKLKYQPTSDPPLGMSFDEAAQQVRSSYGHLLHKLSQ